jgi:hypothetical protein
MMIIIGRLRRGSEVAESERSKGLMGSKDQTKRSKGTDADEAACGAGGGVKGEILVKEAEFLCSSRG